MADEEYATLQTMIWKQNGEKVQAASPGAHDGVFYYW